MPSLIESDAGLSRGSRAGKKRIKILVRDVESFPITLRILACPISLSRCGGCAGDNDGGKSDAHCTYSLGEQNNMNMDSRHKDSSGRTGADSTRKDNN